MSDAAQIEVAATDHYVSRAAHKLIAGLDAFGVAVAGRTALDMGASTGGFTQVLRERGADPVIAVDVGHGQLAASVADDPGVISIEGFNVRYMTPDSLARGERHRRAPAADHGDLSFISLSHVLPAARAVASTDADLVLLVKPQFEVGRTAVKGGLVTDAASRADAVAGRAAGRRGTPASEHAASSPPRSPARTEMPSSSRTSDASPAARAGEQSDRMVEHREPTDGESMNDAERNILVVVHARRDDTVAAAQRVVSALRAAGARPVLSIDDREELGDALALLGQVATLGVDVSVEDIELAIVLGGDGTILRAAELVREGTAPVLGINMGHVGFLAEIERDDMDDAVQPRDRAATTRSKSASHCRCG